jgi:hypothetical protein
MVISIFWALARAFCSGESPGGIDIGSERGRRAGKISVWIGQFQQTKPQGLKPRPFILLGSTAKAVPCYRQRLKPKA